MLCCAKSSTVEAQRTAFSTNCEQTAAGIMEFLLVGAFLCVWRMLLFYSSQMICWTPTHYCLPSSLILFTVDALQTHMQPASILTSAGVYKAFQKRKTGTYKGLACITSFETIQQHELYQQRVKLWLLECKHTGLTKNVNECIEMIIFPGQVLN